MQTKYAFGRLSLPAPVVTPSTGGSINGNNTTYYFWLKARNRVGHNNVSNATSVVIPNSRKITIAASSFAVYGYEDWMSILVAVSTTNDYNTSRVIYRQELKSSNQLTAVTPIDVVITDDFSINGNVVFATVDDVPDTGLHGFRIYVTSTQKVYEYLTSSNLPVDNITVLPAIGGQWVNVASNSLIEVDTNCTKQLFQVTENELLEAPLQGTLEAPVPIKYYLFNNDAGAFNSGELQLNAYVSDKSLSPNYNVKVLGYLNMSSYALDITGITYVNTIIEYPTTKISLSKPLPANHSLVIEVTPNIVVDVPVVEGTYVTLYPKLNPYTVIEAIPDYGEPVDDIATLKALSSIEYKDKQARYVKSKKILYVFDSFSTLADNGDTVLIPVGNPATGRWISNTFSIPDNTITPEMLTSSTVDLFSGEIQTTTDTLNSSQNYTINTDTLSSDYLILITPLNDNAQTVINISGTLSNNTTRAIILELRQRTGAVIFDASFTFPGGISPSLSGNNKTDLFVLKLVKDGNGTLKKRAYLVQKDIG